MPTSGPDRERQEVDGTAELAERLEDLADGDGRAPVLVERLGSHDQNATTGDFRHAVIGHGRARRPRQEGGSGFLQRAIDRQVLTALGHSTLRNNLSVSLARHLQPTSHPTRKSWTDCEDSI